MSAHPSQLRLDEWILGRRPPEIAAHVTGCARCTERLATLEAERATFLLRARPQAFADAVLARKRPGWGWPRFAMIALAACALLFIFRPRDEGDGYKSGDPQALLFVKQADRVTPWGPEQALRKGDVLQIIVLSPRPIHVAVVDVEEGGETSELYAGAMRAGRTPLPKAFQLDGWTGPEKIVVLFDNQPIQNAKERAKRSEGNAYALKRIP